MSKTQQIEPFNDHFIECYINSMLSVVLHYDPTYIHAANLNSYTYFSQEFQRVYFPIPYVNYSEDYYENFNSVIDIYSFKFRNLETDTIISELKQQLNNGNHLIVFTDLYYWSDVLRNNLTLPDKFHIMHATTYTEYDENHKKFHVYDMDEHFKMIPYTVSESELADALVKTDDYLKKVQISQDYNYRTLKPKAKIKPFVLHLSRVRMNASRIIKELTFYKDISSDYEKLSELLKINTSLLVVTCTFYGSVQHSNKLLFEHLHSLGYLSKVHMVHLNELVESLLLQSNIILTRILKARLRNRWSNVSQCIQSWYNLFKIEIEIWERFLVMTEGN